MTITTLLTTEDFETSIEVDFGVDSTEDSEDNYQISLTVNEDNSLTGIVEGLELTEDEASPIVFADINPDELLDPDNIPDHLEIAINLDDGNDDLTETSENQVVLTIIDVNDLTDRQFTDPLTGATVDFADSDFLVTIENETLSDTEENNLVLEEDNFTLDLDSEVIGVSVEELVVSSDSEISFEYSLGSSSSLSAAEMNVALDDEGGVAINQSADNSTI